MNLYLYKTGKLVMAETGKPLEGIKLDDLYAFVDNPQDGDTLVYDGTAGIWKVTAAKAILPIAIEDPQEGDTLVYDATDGVWKNVAAETPAEPTTET